MAHPKVKQSTVMGLILAGLALAAFVVVAMFDPMQYGFYPKCMLHSVTGLSCPGCGALRAMHALGQGEFAEAVRLNPLVVLGFPCLGLLFALKKWRERKLPPAQYQVFPNWLVWSGLAVLLLFGILRNIPVPPFTWLAP
jgi:hypothetical protein